MARTSTQEGCALTQGEWLHEIGMAEDKQSKGNLQAAFARLMTLLNRIEAQSEGTQVGRGSFEHCRTLQELARCLRADGQAGAAEVRLREALVIIDALLVLRILETISQPTQEEVIASLPSAIREALESGDAAAIEQAFQAPEEQRKAEEAMRYLQVLDEGTEEEPG